MHKTHQPCASLHQLSATKHIGKHCQTLIGTWVLHGTATVTVINIKKMIWPNRAIYAAGCRRTPRESLRTEISFTTASPVLGG